jgi:hypothetical protein
MELSGQCPINASYRKVGASTRSGFSDVLLSHKSGAFVLAQPGKLRMPEPIHLGPVSPSGIESAGESAPVLDAVG